LAGAAGLREATLETVVLGIVGLRDAQETTELNEVKLGPCSLTKFVGSAARGPSFDEAPNPTRRGGTRVGRYQIDTHRSPRLDRFIRILKFGVFMPRFCRRKTDSPRFPRVKVDEMVQVLEAIKQFAVA